MHFIISQLLGGIALILVCISYFCKKKMFLILHIFANVFYGAAFIVSNSLVAGINTFISIVRTFVFYLYEKKDEKISHFYILIFAVLYIAIGVIFFKLPWDILTTITPILFTTAMTFRKMIVVNFIMLFPNIILCVYNVANQFYTSAILDAIESGVIFVAIISYFVVKYREKRIMVKLM